MIISILEQRLEKMRIDEDLPAGGFWDFNLTRNAWQYSYKYGDQSFAVTFDDEAETSKT